MKIGIAFDTPDMYSLGNENHQYSDFADISSIHVLKREMESLGHEVELLGNAQNIMQLLKSDSLSCDLVYNTVEGVKSRNREGMVPSLLELHNIPYIGTDAFGLSFTLDKQLTKILAEHLHILTPNYFIAGTSDLQVTIENKLKKMKFPVIVKPNCEGNSSGICVCESKQEAVEQIMQRIHGYHSPILCEEFIFGKEITVPLIGNPPDEILFGVASVDTQKDDDAFWLDVDQKLFGDYQNIILEVPEKVLSVFMDASLKLFHAIGCRDFARFDYRMTKDNKIYFIEVNPLPALFIGGSFDMVGRHHGLSFSKTLQRIITVACERLSIPKI